LIDIGHWFARGFHGLVRKTSVDWLIDIQTIVRNAPRKHLSCGSLSRVSPPIKQFPISAKAPNQPGLIKIKIKLPKNYR